MYDSNGFLVYAPGPSSGKTSTIKIPPAQNNFTLECDKYGPIGRNQSNQKNKCCLEQTGKAKCETNFNKF